jgi:hypothetical protein
MSSSQTTAQQANGVDAYLATPSSSKKQKVSNGEQSGEKKKKAKKSAD